MTELNIITRIAQGDEAAFDQFMDEHAPKIYALTYSLLSSHEDAEEVASDVFYQVWKHRSKLMEIENISKWLNTLAYHQAIGYWRKKSKRSRLCFLEDLRSNYLAQTHNPLEEIISQEEQENLNRAIDDLPDKCKHVFFLALVDHIPYQDIADMLGITVATVNYHVAYARNFLRKSIREH